MSAVAAIAIPVILEMARKVGAPMIERVLRRHVGDTAGDVAGTLAGTVIDAVADKAGVRPDQLSSAPLRDLENAVHEVEAQTPELILAHLEQQREANRLQLAEMEQEQTWTWAWRPAWMWLLAFLWTYAFVLRPLVNAATGASIEAFDLAQLMTLTIAFMGLYMGGHTAKDFIKARWKDSRDG